MDPMMMMGNGRFSPFFFGWKWLRDDVTLLETNVMSSFFRISGSFFFRRCGFASGRHYLRIYGSGAGFVGYILSRIHRILPRCDVNLSWQNALAISLNKGLKRGPVIFKLKAWYFNMSEVIKFLLVGGS